MITFLSGLLLLLNRAKAIGPAFLQTSWGAYILTGAGIGFLMFLNVWFIIWVSQKKIFENAQGKVKHSDEVLAKCAAKAALASRTNTLFSFPMLFFMAAASHLPTPISGNGNGAILALCLFVIIGGLQLNGIMGKMGPMKSVRGVICSGVVLTAVLYGLIEAFI